MSEPPAVAGGCSLPIGSSDNQDQPPATAGGSDCPVNLACEPKSARASNQAPEKCVVPPLRSSLPRTSFYSIRSTCDTCDARTSNKIRQPTPIKQPACGWHKSYARWDVSTAL